MFDYGDKFYTSFGGGSSSSFLGQGIYSPKNQNLWYFKYIVKPLWRCGYKYYRAKLWFRYRFVKQDRYNVIYTDLEPRYYDIDTVMLHGMFALLDRYVERENEGVDALEQWGKELLESGSVVAEFDNSQGVSELEVVTLYRWWHETRRADLKRRDYLVNELYGKKERLSFEPFDEGATDETAMHREFETLEQKIEDEEDAMLHRLIDVRRGLWT
jgi:hypothetical protein